MFAQDFVINEGGQLRGHGPVGALMAQTRMDPGLSRPYFNDDDGGRPSVTINSGRVNRVPVKNKQGQIVKYRREPDYVEVRVKDLQDAGVQLPWITTNATSLRKEEWLMYDEAAIPPQRERLRLVADIGRLNTFSFAGLGVKILEHETMSDPGQAYQDIDGLSEGTNDTPLWQLEGQPVPVTHASFTLDLRTLESSRRSGMPLSTRGVEWCTRRIMEKVEKTSIGVAGNPILYGGNSTQVGGYSRTPGVYGLINFPDRMTKTDLTVPTGANPQSVYDDVLEMRDLMYEAKHYGPYGIYHSTDYDRYLDAPYAFSSGTDYAMNPAMTLRQAIMGIGTEDSPGQSMDNRQQIRFVKRLDFLTPANSHTFTMIMVSLQSNVIRRDIGMPVTIFQYELKGGWIMCFRVVTIDLIEMFADYNGNCGVLHARAA